MKVMIEHLGRRFEAEDETGVDIMDAFDLFEDVLSRTGFERERIRGAFLFKAEQIETEDKDAKGRDGTEAGGGY